MPALSSRSAWCSTRGRSPPSAAAAACGPESAPAATPESTARREQRRRPQPLHAHAGSVPAGRIAPVSTRETTGFTGTDRVGAEPGDAAADVPAHGDRQRGRAARRDRRRARLGERRRRPPTTGSGTRRSRSASAPHGISEPVRYWVNSGLMTLFFFVVGLEARREFDMGELRERRRRRAAAGRRDRRDARAGRDLPRDQRRARPSAHGWGVAMSTDTAFALGMLALVGPRFPDRLRAFLLTVVVVDDVVAIVVIAIVYSDRPRRSRAGARRRAPRGAAASSRALGVRAGPVYALLGSRPGSRCSSPGSTRSWSASPWGC